MPRALSNKIVTARIKTDAVQDSVRQAEADLRETNDQLAETVVGSVVTKEAVDAALLQNLQVEGELHDAVKELQVVKELLKGAEQGAAPGADHIAPAGHRSGEGVGSVLEHMVSTLKTQDSR